MQLLSYDLNGLLPVMQGSRLMSCTAGKLMSCTARKLMGERNTKVLTIPPDSIMLSFYIMKPGNSVPLVYIM